MSYVWGEGTEWQDCGWMGKNQNVGLGRHISERGHRLSLKRTPDLVAMGGFNRPHFSPVYCGADLCGLQDLGVVVGLWLPPNSSGRWQPQAGAIPGSCYDGPHIARTKNVEHADCSVPT